LGASTEDNFQTLQSLQTKKRKLNDVVEVVSEFLQPLQRADTLWDTLYNHAHEMAMLEKYVYFIRMVDTSYVKIGFSGDVTRRLKELRTGNAIDLQLEYKFKSRQFRLHESNLHEYFIDNNVQGEWFELPWYTDYDAIVHKVCRFE
jgi:hypothetical protein